MTTVLRVNRVQYPVTALGPGTRVGVWVQGCTIGCKGCISRDTWDPGAGEVAEIGTIVAEIDRLVDGPLDGMTISGGEPFEQAASVGSLVRETRRWARDRGFGTIDALVYSGLSLKELRRSHAAVLSSFDLVVSEPFDAALPSDDGLRGSSNQLVTALTSLGRQRLSAPTAPNGPRLQVEVDEDGRIWMIGIPRRGDMSRLERRLRTEGVELEGVSWRP